MSSSSNPQVFGVPHDGSREWLGFHGVVGLHVWLIFQRIRSEEVLFEQGRSTKKWKKKLLSLLGQDLYDRFWEEAVHRVRDTGVSDEAKSPGLFTCQRVVMLLLFVTLLWVHWLANRCSQVFEMLVNKHLRKAQEITMAMNLELDNTVVVENDRNTEFGGALWRTIYWSVSDVCSPVCRSCVPALAVAKLTSHQESLTTFYVPP